MPTQDPGTIVFLLFDRFTTLDITGPYEVLSRIPEYRIFFAGKEKRTYRDPYGLELKAEYALDEISRADIVLVPGGFGIDSLMNDQDVIHWLREIDQTTQWTASVCSGSLLLAQAGLLENRRCTTHWRRKDQLSRFNVIVENKRYVDDGKYITSAGVSAGIDMALYLVAKLKGELAGKIIQLSMEYDPDPPFNCGSPEKAPMEVLEKLKNR